MNVTLHGMAARWSTTASIQRPLSGSWADELGQTVLDECQCPSCENFFVEPKCLPCSHSVCRACLKDLVRHGSRRIECPVDGKRFHIPKEGTDSFPNNTLLVRLTKSLSKKARADMEQSLKELRGNIEKAISDRRQEGAFDLDASRAKLKIKQAADQLRDIIKAKESQMCSSVERMAAEKKNEVRLTGHTLQEGKEVADEMEYILSRENDPGRILRNSDDFLPAARSSSSALSTVVTSSKKERIVDFTSNIPLQQYLSRSSLGSICFAVAKTVTPPQNPFAVPDHLSSKFHPRAIAANETGHIAVADQGNDCILLYDEAGQFLRQIGDKRGQQQLYFPHSITFHDNKEMIVVDGSGNASHRLLVYDISGKLVRTLTDVNGPNVRLLSVSAEPSGRIIVACKQHKKQHRCCIRVCGRNYKDIQYVATEAIINPLKVIWLSGKIYVLDGLGGNVVNVYNQYGEFQRNFFTNFTSSSMRVAVDQVEEQILLWRKSTKKVEVFKPNGTLVRELGAVVDGIEDMAVTSSGHLAVIKTHADKSSSIQLISSR